MLEPSKNSKTKDITEDIVTINLFIIIIMGKFLFKTNITP